MTMQKATLTIEIGYDEAVTDAESIASAADTLLETALSTPGIMDDYGPVSFGDFYVANQDMDSAELADQAEQLRKFSPPEND